MLSVKRDPSVKDGPGPAQPWPKEEQKLGVDVCLLPTSEIDWAEKGLGDAVELNLEASGAGVTQVDFEEAIIEEGVSGGDGGGGVGNGGGGVNGGGSVGATVAMVVAPGVSAAVGGMAEEGAAFSAEAGAGSSGSSSSGSSNSSNSSNSSSSPMP